jgi:hypothetical protein
MAAVAYRVIMLAACLKFTVSEHAQMLAQKLIATGHRELVMADPDDAFLGIGLDRVAATAHIAGGSVDGFEVELEGGGKFAGREEGVFDGEVSGNLPCGVVFSD